MNMLIIHIYMVYELIQNELVITNNFKKESKDICVS